MNILFLLSARRWGGNEKWTRMAAHALATDHRVSLAYREPAVGGRLDVPRYRLPFRSAVDPVTLGGVARIMRRHRVDLVIATKPKDYAIAGIVSRLLHRRSLLRLGIVRKLRHAAIDNLVYNRWNDGIIVNAPEIKEALLQSPFMKPERIRVIFNGIDGEELDALAGQVDAGVKPFPFTVCAMGELSHRKGFDLVIEGFARFCVSRGSNPTDAGLLIVGEGEQRACLERLVRDRGLSGRVRFTGALANPFPLLGAADVYVQGSRNEGLSNALLEAMYLGVVAIATGAGGSRHAIEDGVNGFLMEETDPVGQISRLLAGLYAEPAVRRRMAEEGRRTVVRRFLLSRMKDEIAAFARETILRHTPA